MAFKYYKSREPPPDLNKVINAENPDHLTHFKPVSPRLSEVTEECSHIKPNSSWTILESLLNPGFYVILNAFSPEDTHHWTRECLVKYSSSEYRRNIDGQLAVENWFPAAQEDPALVDKLRWSTLGYHHNWDTKKYSDDVKGEFPSDLASVCKYLASALGYTSYEAEAAIVNFYPPTSTLSGHTDHSEPNLNAPLFSLSFGASAVFLLGSPSLDTEPVPYLIKSGTVVVMTKEARLSYHAVPRIICDTKDVPGNKSAKETPQISATDSLKKCGNEFIKEYLTRHRINLNIRQVN